MTQGDTSGSGQPPGGLDDIGRDLGLSAAMFTDLARPLGPLEAVERLRILETLSYGVLYEGRMFQASHGEPIGLLELDSAFEKEPAVLARLLTELLKASRLRDASILSPRGVFRHGDSLYVLSDALNGVSLATAFEFLGRSGLRLSSEAVLRVGSAAIAALDCVAGSASGTEEGCHGLFTPENLFIAEGQVVRVRGFGFWAGGIGRTGLLGPSDLRYLAPSQRRTGAASARTDLLSLGTILFEAVVGFPAFDAPPEEEDLTELRGSVEELQRKADTSMQDLYQVILSCLTPPGLITMPYRARLRKAIDTLFVREAARDRPFGALTLEDLVGRVKQRRPAIVKAIPLSLLPAEAGGVPSPAVPEEDFVPEPAGDEPSSDAMTSPPQEPEEIPPLPPIPVAPPAPARAGPRIPSTLWMFAGAAVAMVAFALIFLNSWPRSEGAAVPARPTIAPPLAVPAVSAPPMVPTEAAAVATPVPEIPTVVPTAAPTAAPTRPATAALRGSSAERRRISSSDTLSRRTAASRSRPERPATGGRSEAASPAASPPGEPASVSSSAPVPITAGALVPLGTAGLVRPVLVEKPESPRIGDSGQRPFVERSVQLEILVNDLGRVRGSRIVRAEGLPPGFFGVIERYLSGLRFRPAEVGGVPVRVWMPYDLRYWAP